jgi:hypothetical protein
MAYNKPPDDGKYLVQEGDWVGSIAMDYGYTDWKHDIWMRSENSDLRDKRPSPYILAPGDVIFIPPWEDKSESCATEQKHKFKLKAPTEILRIRLLDPDGKPFKNQDYKLTLTWDPGGGTFEQQGKKTDADGILKETVPSTTTMGKLYLSNLKQTITLRFGFLTPMDPNNEVLLNRGAKQRLLAIGFNPGTIDGTMNNVFVGALKSFQRYCNEWKGKMAWVIDAGDIDGTVSDKTQKALTKFYGA